MSKFKQILMELGGTALNIPVGELTALVDKAEDDIDVNAIAKVLKDKYRDNLNAFGKTQKDDGFKSAERSTNEKWEKSLKTKFNVSSDKIGDELVDLVHAAASKKTDSGKGDMTEDKIKLSDTYIQMENNFKAQLKKAQDDSQKAIDDLKAGYTRKETFAKVSTALDTLWESEGFLFDDDATRAANKKQDLKEKFSSYEWQQNGDTFIAMKDGKPVENEYGHKIEFKDFVNGITEKYYAKKVTDKRSSPHSPEGGNDDPSKDKQKKYTGVMPKTQDEYEGMYNDPKIPIEHKLEILDYWKANNK